jgi:phage tail-like protein
MNERGQVALRYTLHKAWVSEFQHTPDLDANQNAVAIENIKIEIEGFSRDPDLPEPNEADPVPPLPP